MGRQGKDVPRYLTTWRKERILEIDRRNNRPPSVENSLRIWVRTSRRTDYWMHNMLWESVKENEADKWTKEEKAPEGKQNLFLRIYIIYNLLIIKW